MQELTVHGELLSWYVLMLDSLRRNIGLDKVQYVSCEHQLVPKVKPTSAMYKSSMHHQCSALLK